MESTKLVDKIGYNMSQDFMDIFINSLEKEEYENWKCLKQDGEIKYIMNLKEEIPRSGRTCHR